MINIQNNLKNMDRFVASHAYSTMYSMKEQRQKGAGAVEYSLVLGAITLLIVGLAGTMEGPLKEFFTSVTTEVQKFVGGE